MENSIFIDYILSQPQTHQDHLQQTYQILEQLLGDKTTKTMAYQMPTYKAKRNVIHFAAFSKHIGIYPGPDAIAAFADELTEYKYSKGTVKIGLNQPYPTELVKKLALYSYEHNK